MSKKSKNVALVGTPNLVFKEPLLNHSAVPTGYGEEEKHEGLLKDLADAGITSIGEEETTPVKEEETTALAPVEKAFAPSFEEALFNLQPI